MTLSTTVKLIHSGMAGAPVLSGTAGALPAVLDVLVNGFGLASVDSVAITGGVATVTRAAGHPFEPYTVCEIAGAAVSGGSINGQHKVLSISSTTYTFEATGIPNQSATGAITHKVAGCGWTKPFAAGSVACYRSGSVEGTGVVLRVDDSAAQVARVVGYEAMSDANTGTGPFPTAAQQSGGLYWSKSSSASATGRAWRMHADDRGFVLRIANGANVALLAFGDCIPRKTPDPFCAALSGSNGDYSATVSNVLFCLAYADSAFSSATGSPVYMPRAGSGLGSAVRMIRWPVMPVSQPSGQSAINSGAGVIPYPNDPDNALLVTDLQLVGSNGGIRGRFPGVFWAPQALGGAFALGDMVDATADLPGRKMMAVTGGNGNALFVDVTGPWR